MKLQETMDTRTDANLVEAAISGNERAFQVLVERHFDAVYLTAYSRLCNREASEDLAQEVFLRAFLHLAQLKDPDRFSHWVCRVARNLAEDWRRRHQTHSRLLPMVPLEETMPDIHDTHSESARDRLQREERESAIRQAVESLPEELREIVLLHYCSGLSEREIARQLGLHHTTVRYHRLRAMQLFKDQVASWLETDAPALRPPRKAMMRASAVITVAAAMDAGKRQVLANTASSISPMPTVPVDAGSGAGLTGLLFGSKAATAATGVIAMAGTKTWILTGILLTVALTGGGMVYQQSAKPGGFLNPMVQFTPSAHKAAWITAPPPGSQETFAGFTLQQAVARIYGLQPDRVFLGKGVPSGRYDISISGTFPTKESVRTAFENGLKKELGVRAKLDSITTEVFVLKAPTGRTPGLRDPDPNVTPRFTGGRVRVARDTLDPLCFSLQEALQRPVLNETGMTGKYCYELKWHPRKRDTVLTSVKDQLGLELVKEPRKVSAIVLEREVAQ